MQDKDNTKINEKNNSEKVEALVKVKEENIGLHQKVDIAAQYISGWLPTE